jgi:hypothetical protein
MISFLNRNDEKWPHTRQIKIVGRNHIENKENKRPRQRKQRPSVTVFGLIIQQTYTNPGFRTLLKDLPLKYYLLAKFYLLLSLKHQNCYCLLIFRSPPPPSRPSFNIRGILLKMT